jgi:hypothetical protein
MKAILLSALTLLSPLILSSHAGDGLLLQASSKVISQPDLKQPLGAEWSTGKGKWELVDGMIRVTDLPEEHHIPVLHLATGPASLIWECEFRFNAGKSFLVGCDAQKHVGRVVIGPKNFKICEDSTEVKGKTPSHTLSETAVDLKAEEWHTLRVEAVGDRMAARLDGVELRAEHAYLATPKVRWWFAAADSTQIRKVRITEGELLKSAAPSAQ